MKDSQTFPTYVGGGDLWEEPGPQPPWWRVLWFVWFGK
jgi:hypothetical protein